MAIWLFRAGSSGEYENKFLIDGKIYLTWNDLNVNLKSFKEKADLFEYLNSIYPTEKRARNRNWMGQIWPIAHDIKISDWIVLPSKIKSAIHIGKVVGEYEYDSKAEDPYYHSVKVEWFAQDIPRSNFDQDLLYSFGAFMTVCRISRNNAEERIHKMASNGWKPSTITDVISLPLEETVDIEQAQDVDLEEYSKDAIAKYIIRRFKGHDMTKLINAILIAQGYTTYVSPEGPDKGVDILAAPGTLGFGQPKICIQVKTQDTPVERVILDQLIGTMQNFSADYGLLVSWYGFKQSVYKEQPLKFFKVRLWEQKDIIRELLQVYDKIHEDIKAEIPLKRIWTLSNIEE